VSLAPLLKGGNKVGRDAIYWHYPHYSNQGGVPGGAVRRGDWKLIEFYEDDRIELYNVSNDPGERTNLARREAKLAGSLRSALEKWRGSIRAVMPAANPQYEPGTADQGLTGAEPKTDPV
jgi:arylsulfatase A-like enzyme